MVSQESARELRDCAEQAVLLDYRMEQLYKAIQTPEELTDCGSDFF